MLTHAQLTEIWFRSDACWVIIDFNGRSTYTPAVIRVGNNPLIYTRIIAGNTMPCTLPKKPDFSEPQISKAY